MKMTYKSLLYVALGGLLCTFTLLDAQAQGRGGGGGSRGGGGGGGGASRSGGGSSGGGGFSGGGASRGGFSGGSSVGISRPSYSGGGSGAVSRPSYNGGGGSVSRPSYGGSNGSTVQRPSYNGGSRPTYDGSGARPSYNARPSYGSAQRQSYGTPSGARGQRPSYNGTYNRNVGRGTRTSPYYGNGGNRNGYNSPRNYYHGGFYRGGRYYNQGYYGGGYYGGYYNNFYGGFYNSYYLPNLGFSIGVLPFGYYPFYWGNSQYYYSDGLYYQQQNDQYTVVEPPVGAEIKQLPEKASSIIINGVQYYELNGVYYQPVTKDDGTVVYQIAGKDGELNTDTEDGEEALLPLVGDIIIELPTGSRKVKLNGEKLYIAPDGVYYKEDRDANDNKVYRVVGVPPEESAPQKSDVDSGN